MTDKEHQDVSMEGLRKMIREEVNAGKPEVPDNVKKDKQHYTRSYEKYCSDCGTKNDNYKKAKKTCTDCDAPNSDNAKVCWNCGDDEFEEDSEEED